MHELVYATHPFDVVGWDGYNFPYGFSIHNFEPITGRVHQPHQSIRLLKQKHMLYARSFLACLTIIRRPFLHLTIIVILIQMK